MAAMRVWTGQAGRRWGGGLAVVAALGLLAAVGLTACGPDAATADTVLTQAPGAVVRIAGGRVTPAREGMVVPRGATVVSGPDGALLTTLGRQTLLGASSEVTVLDGAREALRSGQVLLNATSGPGLDLDAGAATVTAAAGSLSRVERAALLRVGQFRGASSVRASGRRARTDLPRLYQVQVPFGGLPEVATPLVLSDDQWERRFARDLVESDLSLTALARGLDAPGPEGPALVRLLPAAFTETSPPQPGAARSEQALAFVLAGVAKGAGASPVDRYLAVRGLRDAGGSWGVVAALVDARTDNVSGLLDRLLGAPGSLAALPGGPGQLTPSQLSQLLGTPAAPGPGRSPGPAPRPSGGPVPSRTPTPTPGPTTPVDQVANAVRSLAPTPPGPTPSPSVTVPVPGSSHPSPLVTANVGPVHIQVGG